MNVDVSPNRPKIGELGVQWEGIGKFQALTMKFCAATTTDPRNMPAKFKLNRAKITGARDPQFWVSIARYGKTSNDRVEILYSDYPDAKKHDC